MSKVSEKAKQSKGKAKEKVGRISGDRQMETEGHAEQAASMAREAASKAKDGATHAVGAAKDSTRQAADKVKNTAR
ncbi:CsbD family protein [Kitasatospora sp. NPDC056138]|uniref:CsbD family protein n=1 Tax=Kitasatospora sp. NPDC056138 TaxID=3345724 RepID=UPI0035DF8F03